MLRETLNVTPDRVVSTKQQSITGSLSGGVLAPEDSAGSIEDDLKSGFEPMSANCVQVGYFCFTGQLLRHGPQLSEPEGSTRDGCLC